MRRAAAMQKNYEPRACWISKSCRARRSKRSWTRAKDFQPRRPKFQTISTLRGRMIVNLFFEASTRTRTSFEIAAKTAGRGHRFHHGAGPACRKANRWWTR